MQKAEAIAFLGSMIRARKWCLEHRTGIRISREEWQAVERPYNEYHRTWTTTGLARYLVKYQHTLRMLATGGSKQVEQLNRYIEQAEEIQTIQGRVNPVNQTGTASINLHTTRPAVNCDCR